MVNMQPGKLYLVKIPRIFSVIHNENVISLFCEGWRVIFPFHINKDLKDEYRFLQGRIAFMLDGVIYYSDYGYLIDKLKGNIKEL